MHAGELRTADEPACVGGIGGGVDEISAGPEARGCPPYGAGVIPGRWLGAC